MPPPMMLETRAAWKSEGEYQGPQPDDDRYDNQGFQCEPEVLDGTTHGRPLSEVPPRLCAPDFGPYAVAAIGLARGR